MGTSVSSSSNSSSSSSSVVTMKKFCFLLLVLSMCFLSHGMPPLSRDYNTHCRCVKVESRIIPPNSLRSIKLFPEGPSCATTEVIAGLVSGEKVCLDPASSWVKKLVHFVLEKQLQQGGGAKGGGANGGGARRPTP